MLPLNLSLFGARSLLETVFVYIFDRYRGLTTQNCFFFRSLMSRNRTCMFFDHHHITDEAGMPAKWPLCQFRSSVPKTPTPRRRLSPVVPAHRCLQNLCVWVCANCEGRGRHCLPLYRSGLGPDHDCSCTIHHWNGPRHPDTHGGPLGLHPKSIFLKDFYIIYKIKFLDNNY